MKIKNLFKSKELLIINYALLIALSSCSVSKQIAKQANTILLSDTAISQGHIGISIYEPATGKYWYNYDATKYFVPASNTKLFTLYAGMKYLGDSLVAMRYKTVNDTIYVLPAGDPSFMHPDFEYQPANNFFNSTRLTVKFSVDDWGSEKFGIGWAWDDYNDDYMAERSPLPIYGNLMKVGFKKYNLVNQHDFKDTFLYYGLEIISPQSITNSSHYYLDSKLKKAIINRQQGKNNFDVYFPDTDISFQKQIPFVTDGIKTALQILHARYPWIDSLNSSFNILHSTFNTIHSQPSDSLFKPMMHRSDNFFAEQTLLMASNERLGYMDDAAIIDTLLKSDMKTVPQRPKWVDGSGLSRYNLFTPQSFIYILDKLKTEFGWNRIKNILPTGGEGTLKSWYLKDSGFIYAKTGTLSNHCALSGYLITNKGKFLIFSILANHYQTGATPIRKAVERFLEAIKASY